MRRGYFVNDSTGSGGRRDEADVLQCPHCEAAMRATPTGPTGWCYRCGARICRACARTGRCVPFERRLEQAAHHARFARAAGLQER